MPETLPHNRVHGLVTGPNGQPLRDAKVIVWWQHIRARTELARTETNEHGYYETHYRVPQDAPTRLLIVVEAYTEYHPGYRIFSPWTAATHDQRIDLSLDPIDASEWTMLTKAIAPLLEGLSLDSLMEDASHQDISFLANELSRSTEDIMRVSVAARLETAFSVPAPVFYAFLRQHIPSALPDELLAASDDFTLIGPLVQRIASLIFGLSDTSQTQTLTGALALNIIGPQFTNEIPNLVAELQAHRTTDLLNQPYLVGSTTLAQLLTIAQLPRAKQQIFAQALTSNTASLRNFWRMLGDGNHGFTAAEASSIERTLSIGAFVKNHLPLMQPLLDGFSAGTYRSLPDLARFDVSFWIELVRRVGAPPNINATQSQSAEEVFARVVYARITRTYPTAALSGRVASANLCRQRNRPRYNAFSRITASWSWLNTRCRHISRRRAIKPSPASTPRTARPS